ncbi:MAG: glycosyltransferase [bacterium]|nr:glycosyltransferase [bacterium]
MNKAVIILPTYNEVNNVTSLIHDIVTVVKGVTKWNIQILVVDSSSPDGTAREITKLQKQYKQLHLLETPKEGLGKAYVHGFRYAIDKLGADVVFEMDADRSHDSKEIPHFLSQIEHGADFVIGSRYIAGGSIPDDWGIHRKIFSIVANLFIRIGFMKLKITDWTSGYRVIKKWVIQKNLENINSYTGYVFQMALIDNALKSGAHIREIPIKFIDRTEGISKINSGQYIADIFFYILRNSSFIKFCIVGGTGFLVDFGVSYLLIEILTNNVVFSTVLSAELAIMSNFVLNNYWSFAHKKIENANEHIFWSFIKFNMVASGSIGIQALGMFLATSLLGETYWYVYKVLIITLVIIPYSYILYNRYIWKEHKLV